MAVNDIKANDFITYQGIFLEYKLLMNQNGYKVLTKKKEIEDNYKKENKNNDKFEIFLLSFLPLLIVFIKVFIEKLEGNEDIISVLSNNLTFILTFLALSLILYVFFILAIENKEANYFSNIELDLSRKSLNMIIDKYKININVLRNIINNTSEINPSYTKVKELFVSNIVSTILVGIVLNLILDRFIDVYHKNLSDIIYILFVIFILIYFIKGFYISTTINNRLQTLYIMNLKEYELNLLLCNKFIECDYKKENEICINWETNSKKFFVEIAKIEDK